MILPYELIRELSATEIVVMGAIAVNFNGKFERVPKKGEI